MPSYRRSGQLPRKRHTQMHRDGNGSFMVERMYHEHFVTTRGFDRAYSYYWLEETQAAT